MERPDPRSARILLAPAAASQARDLFSREQHCCAFFAFDVNAVGDILVVDARVPEGSEASLDLLLSLAPPPPVVPWA